MRGLQAIKHWLRGASAEPEAGEGNTLVADTPIERAEQDLLGRTTMADRIAQILSAPGVKEGRVFAIRGAWGFGKSSLKNLVIEAIGKNTPEVPTLDFNPWQWGSSDAIARALFVQMAGKLGGGHSPDAAKRARALRRYGGVLVGSGGGLGKFGRDSKGLTSLLAAGAVASATLGFAVPGIAATTLSATILALAALAFALGWLLKWIGRDRSADSLDEVRVDLVKRLAALPRPLVVFVDDIDRLEPEQIRLVIRQIKANASLPNINFVLLYQPSIVEEALGPVAAGQGRDYLEKIVQASFDVPPVTGAKLLDIFVQQLGELINPLARTENGFDHTRWGNVLRGGIEPMIRTLRDSRRLLTSIAIHVEMHKGAQAFEVNIVDFLGLETLRVFEPEFHAAIGTRASLMTQTRRFSGDQRHDEHKAEITALLDKVDPVRRPACERLLQDLFPSIEWAIGGAHYDIREWDPEWRKAKRVCSARYFARYFALQLDDSVLSESDFALFVQAASNETELVRLVGALAARGLLPALAHRLDESVGELPMDKPELLLALFFSTGELLGRPNQSLYNEPFTASWRSALWYLHRLPDSASRRVAFEKAFAGSEGMAIPGEVLSIQDAAMNKPDPQNPPILSEDDLEALKALWLERMVAEVVDIERQLAQPNLLARLFRWQQFAGEDVPKAWATSAGSSPDTIVALLRQLLNRGESHTMGDLVGTPTETFHKQHFDAFLPVEVAQASLAKVDKTKLGPTDLRMVALFERYVAAWDKGAPLVEDPDEEDA